MRHRPRGLALTAGTAFTIACLAYLTLWWDASTFNAHAPWRSVWTLVPLAFATAVSVLLGHLVTVTTLAVAVSTAPAGSRNTASRDPPGSCSRPPGS